jgi:6-phosphogluconolactonase (cycloisomerase 2 family)
MGTLTQSARAQGRTGDVYVMTNQAGGNSIMVYHRDSAGALTPVGSFSTGGNGAGSGVDPLGSQGALTLSDDQRFLFAVNAGSNSVSLFAVTGDQLRLLNTAPSGGVMPVSVTAKHDLAYVVNAGGVPNISGFKLDPGTNRLIPLAGSTQSLPGGAGAAPAEIAFTNEGSALIVTEKATSSIDVFQLDRDLPGPGVSYPSSGTTPFGFSFSHNGTVIVSDAGPNAASSYRLNHDDHLAAISGPILDGQAAACWLVVPEDGNVAFVANAGTATISSYSVAPNGVLTLLHAVAGSTGAGSAPTDLALSGDGRFLYVRGGGSGDVAGFRIDAGGTLTSIGSTPGVPPGSQGIAAR